MKFRALFVLLILCPFALAQRGLQLPPPQPVAVPPDVPNVDPDPNFPLRVHLLTARFGGVAGRYHGYGSGNLLDTAGAKGFDYGFECDVPFIPNESASETYQARWKGSSYKLEILTAQTGVAQPRSHTCTLDVALRQRPFEPANTAALTHGVSYSLRKRWQDPDFAYEDQALDYPLHFHVVDGLRDEDSYEDHGWGTANLTDPAAQSSVMGADYTYSCSYGFLTNSQLSGFYQARWVKPYNELEVLLQRPGSDKVDTCKVEVNLKPQPYPQSRHILLNTQVSSAPGQLMPPSP